MGELGDDESSGAGHGESLSAVRGGMSDVAEEASLDARRARIRAALDGDDLLPDLTGDEMGQDASAPIDDGGPAEVLRRYLAEKPPHHVDP